MAKVRAIFYGLGAGRYNVRFKEQGITGNIEFVATDGTDLEYLWIDFASEHGFDIGSIFEVETL